MKFPTNLGQDVVILKANHVIDVFYGKAGWENHTRFLHRRTKNGPVLTQISGKCPTSVYNEVLQKV